MKTFVLVENDRPLLNYLAAMPHDGTFKVEIKRVTSKRSLSQNNLYWMWLTIIGAELGYTSQEMHQLMKFQFLAPKITNVMGKVIEELPSTKDLNIGEFTEYLNRIEQWAAEYSILLPHPEDVYYEAMGLLPRKQA